MRVAAPCPECHIGRSKVYAVRHAIVWTYRCRICDRCGATTKTVPRRIVNSTPTMEFCLQSAMMTFITTQPTKGDQ